MIIDDHGQQPTQCHSGWWLVTSDLSTAAAVGTHQLQQSQHHPPVLPPPAIATATAPPEPASTQPEVASNRFKYVS